MNYNEDDYLNIYTLSRFSNIQEFEKNYPELIKYEDKIFTIVKLHNRDIHNRYVINHFMKETINALINIGDIEYDILPDFLLFIGNDVDCPFIHRLELLVNPEEVINNDFSSYIRTFSDFLKNRIYYPLDINKVLKNERLEKLSQVTRDIKRHHYNTYLKFNNFVYTLIAYSYCYDDSYDLVFMFLERPNYYIDVLISNGYLEFREDNQYSKWLDEETVYRIFSKPESIFNSNKRVIK